MKHITLSKKWIVLWVNVLLVVFSGLCIFGLLRVCTALPTMDAADSWAVESEMSFAQLACYLPADRTIEQTDIYSFRQTLKTKLTEASMEAPENGSLFTDAYSGASTLTVTTERGNAQVKVTGVGGDYFRFHPLKLRSGSYLMETDLMKDRVILDEELAWKLFGGTELTGLSVTINGAEYYVAGVVAREKDPYSSIAYADGAAMFMSYEAMKALDDSAGITCYEIAMPNPITAFAKNMVSEHFPLNNGVVVENSSRYSLGNLLKVIGDFGKRSMGQNGIIYPYWENAVRLTEDYAALYLVLAVLFALTPAISTLVLAYRLCKAGMKKGTHLVKNGIESGIERRREEKWQKAAEKRE